MSKYMEYHAIIDKKWGDIVDTAVSIDIGPKYAAIGQLSEFSAVGRRLVHAMPYSLQDPDGKQDINTVCSNFLKLMLHADQDWIWAALADMPTEMQMDHLSFFGFSEGEEKGEKKEKKSKGKPPICYAIYAMFNILCHLKASPMSLLSSDDIAMLVSKGVNPRALQKPGIKFVPVTGHQKAGIEHLKGNDRKGRLPFEICVEMMEEEGDHAAAAYLKQLSSIGDVKIKKPRQDVVDVCLQARRRLDDKAKARAKEAKVAEKEVTRKRKAETDLAGAPKKRRKSPSPPPISTTTIDLTDATPKKKNTKKPLTPSVSLV